MRRRIASVAAVLVIAALPPLASAAAKSACERPTIEGSPGEDRITGTDARDVIDAGGGADVVDAGGGADVICGGPGADVLRGGAGADLIEGGSGDDVLAGGSGRDRATFLASPDEVNVDLADGRATGWGNDRLEGIADVTGSRGDDDLRGDAGGNRLFGAGGSDVLAGRGGDDRLSGGSGDDVLRGGAGDDRAAYFDAPRAVSVDLGARRARGWGRDELGGIEEVFGSQFDDMLDGGDGADRLLGYDGDDTIDGGGGRDALDGGLGSDACASGTRAACETSPPAWTMFHRDARHTGVAPGTGAITTEPAVRWSYLVTNPAPPANDDDLSTYRWFSTLPLGDVDGDDTLEVIVTSADPSPGDGTLAGGVTVLKDRGADADPDVLWSFDLPARPEGWEGTWGVDQYSPALADADGDGLLDVIFTSKDGIVRALRGLDGAFVWSYDLGRRTEAGPTVADLEGDGDVEVIVPTDCAIDESGGCLPTSGAPPRLYVLAADPGGGDPFLWKLDLEAKSDSEEPAVADLDPDDDRPLKSIVFGSWDARLHVAWRDGEATASRSYPVRSLASVPQDACPAIRSTPVIGDAGEGPTAYFGWMPYPDTCGSGAPGDATEARVSALGLEQRTASRHVTFLRRWPTVEIDAWKSSLAFLPASGDSGALVLGGYGVGQTDDPSNTARFGDCSSPTGGVFALDAETGAFAWRHDYPTERPGEAVGHVRSSAALADVDGDGSAEMVVGLGCDEVAGVGRSGPLYAYDARTGAFEWRIPLGPTTHGSPSVGDLDGDGDVEIAIASYDGRVYVLEGR